MIIPDPKGNRGEIVKVYNYRSKKWTTVKIDHLYYKNMWNEFYWSYDILIKGKSGMHYHIYVTSLE